jgi:hypothetical protein
MVSCQSQNNPPISRESLQQNTAQIIQTNLEITIEASPQPQTLEGAIGPFEFPDIVNPLTGLPVDDPAILNRFPIVTKISNAPPLVRPQSGIGEADIVFEHYAEGGLTRFSAIFYGNAPTRVGSIRSARLIDHELTPMFDGMLAFSGASIGVEKYIYGSDDVNARMPGSEVVAPARYIPPSEYAERAYKGVLYGRPYYWRDESIPVPHNMFVNIAALWELAASQGFARRPRLQGLAFHPDPPPDNSGTADMIDLRYRATRVRWEYNPETGLYYRFADGIGHFDANTQQQITAANVVILYAEHTDTEIIESQWQGSISYSVQIAVWGENDVILFRDGLRYDGRWVRTVREDIIALRTYDGEILYLKPGNTWFQIVREPEQQNPAEEWLNVE